MSLTLDADLVEALEQEPDDALSAQVNAAVRSEVERRRRQHALRDLLGQLDRDDGALTDRDEEEIERYRRALES